MVVIGSRYGQLANQLFLFGHFVAAAARHGFTVWNPGFDDYASYFPAVSLDAFCRFPPQRSRFASRPFRRLAFSSFRRLASALVALESPRAIRLSGTDEFDISDPSFVRRARGSVVFVQGWTFRDHASFSKRAETVRDYFRPAEHHLNSASQILLRARERAEIVIGVHIRRGTYRLFEEGRYFYSREQYAALMHQAEGLFPGRSVAFVVCSDEQVGDPTRFDVDVELGTGHPVEDLYSFAACDYLFGPPSTYTSWASFYGNVPLCMVRDPEEGLALPRFQVFR